MRLPSLLLLAVCTLFTGCGDDRKPIPVLNIRVLADGTFTLNREAMGTDKLRDEIQRIADENRQTIGSGTRVQVRIATQRGASQADKSMVLNTCVAAGISRIEQSAADE